MCSVVVGASHRMRLPSDDRRIRRKLRPGLARRLHFRHPSIIRRLCTCEDCCGGVAGLCPDYKYPGYTGYWNYVQSEWCNCSTCDFASTCEGLLDADCGASSCYLTTTLCSSGGYFPNDACGFCASGFMTTPWMQCVECYEDSDCTDASKFTAKISTDNPRRLRL